MSLHLRALATVTSLLCTLAGLSSCASADAAGTNPAMEEPAKTENAASEAMSPQATVSDVPEKKLESAAPIQKITLPAKSVKDSVRGSPSASDYVERADVQAFLSELARKEGIPIEWLAEEVALARYSQLSERLTTPRPNANKKTTADKNFILYERNIVNSERIERGAEFLEAHKEAFDRAEEKTGVSRYAVAAIIGVESIYGRNMGRFRVLDALMTLSFDYTRRAPYYRSELATFLEFCWEQQISPVTVTGSFAGAMGLGQFMPSSLKAYGVDGDGDGHINIVDSPADGIASVAHYLEAHGWARGERPLYRVEANREIFEATASGGIHTHTTAGALYKAGVKPLETIPLKDDEPAMLVDLPWIKRNNDRGVDYYLGTDSFAAILRYNRSYFYAAAVAFLADELEKADGSQGKKDPAGS